MAISFQEWYNQYANLPGATQIAPNILAALSNNVTNPSYEIGFGNLRTQLGQIGSSYNTGRNTLAQSTRSAANVAGLSDRTDVEEASRTAGNDVLGTTGAVTYKVRMGPDGRAYRQAFLSTGANVGSRSWGGSDDKAGQWSARQALNTQKSRMLDDFTTKQNQSVLDQGRDETGKIGEIATNISDYGQWKIGATPNSPSGLDAAGGGGASDAPPADDGPDVPANNIIWKGANAPNKAAINALAKNKYGGRKVVIKKRGGNKGYVAVLV